MKYIFLCILILSLSSCFGIWGWDNENNGLVLSDTEDFSVLVPDSWIALSGDELPVPKSWTTALALKSTNERSWYFNNMIILSSENIPDTNSLSLMNSTESMLKRSLKSYELISKKDISFLDNDTGSLIVFSWKYNDSTPKIQYVQTAKMCWDMSYFITISVWEVLDNYDRYEDVLKTFRCN